MAKRNKEDGFRYAKYTGMAFEMMIISALFACGGYHLDKWLKPSFPVFTLVLSILGIALAMYSSLKDFIKKDKK